MTTPKIKYRKYLGPSYFATALGRDPFMTADALRVEIEQGSSQTGNYATQFGQSHEQVALYYYMKLHNVIIQKPRFVVDPLNPRIGGICDGLITSTSAPASSPISLEGIEVKCHIGSEPLSELPFKYRLQLVGYMYLYKVPQWTLMSCVFNKDHTISKYRLFTIMWDEVKDQWNSEWYPAICHYINGLTWKT